MLLEGKVALVTGAARGFGWGIARALGLAGSKVCVTDISDKELARCAADLQRDGTEVRKRHLDVSDLVAFQEAPRRWLTVGDGWTWSSTMRSICP
jgi:NAD(P)-dependent dehydrogenase (short-subunit alcohol dehydrogenase family)